MTGYAIHIEHDRATIACDTAVYIAGSPARLVGYDTKLTPLAHLKAAIFGRGMSGIIADVIAQVTMAPQLADTLEHLAEVLPCFLRPAAERYCRATGLGQSDAYGLVELFLVGWSEAERRMRLWFFANIEDFKPRTDFAHQVGEPLSVPPLPEMPPRLDSVAANLAAIMVAQKEFFEAHPETGGMIGGEVHAWEIGRNGLSQRTIYKFPAQQTDTEIVHRINSGAERLDMAERLFPADQMREAGKALSHILSGFPGIRESRLSDTPGSAAARTLTSPILIENYVRAWTGGLGTYALQISDAALRKAGIVPDPPKPEDTLSDIPVVKAFAVRYPTASAQSIQDFYDAYKERKTYLDTFKAQAKAGNVDAMLRVQQEAGPAMFVLLQPIHDALGTAAQTVRNTWADPYTPPAEKRQLIDDAYAGMVQIAQQGMEIMRATENLGAPSPVTGAAPPAVPIPPPIPGPGRIERLRAAGFSDDEILQSEAAKSSTAAKR